MSAQLGFFAESPRLSLGFVRRLSASEHARYTEASGTTLDFVHDYQQFQMVRSSYNEYKKVVKLYSEKYRVRPRMTSATASEMNHAINRKLRGFFTEFRFFLDYAERKLKRQYGKLSTEADQFKRATGEQFDSSFAYRFVSQLRNYGQHINLPINALSLRSDGFNFFLATTEHRLLVEVDRDELLTSGFDWRAKDVRPQLEALPEKFELDSHIEEMMECLEKINVAFVCINLWQARRAARHIEELAEEVGGKGTPCVYELETPDDAIEGRVYPMNTDISWMPVDIARFITRLPHPQQLSQSRKFVVNFKSPSG